MSGGGALRACADALGFGNGVVAAAAAALAAAASRAMELPPDPWVLALAAAGTLMVYGLDRLRDVSRDREKSPLRTAWVERHRRALTAATALGACVALAAGHAAAHAWSRSPAPSPRSGSRTGASSTSSSASPRT